MLTVSADLPSTLDQGAMDQVISTRSANITLNASYKNETKGLETNRTRGIDKSFSMSKNLSEIKERRKLMESNAQLLFNRLQVLSQEEYKLKKNAFEIKKRSQELLSIRLNRDKEKNKDELDSNKKEKAKVNELSKLRKAIFEAKQKNKSETERVKNLVTERRLREAQEVRLQKLLNEEKITSARLKHIESQKAKSQKVRDLEEAAGVKVKEYHKIKAEMMKSEREKLIKEEEDRIWQKELEIQKLGYQEDVMLDLLSKAENSETRAKTEYEEISTLPVDDLATRYNYYLKTEGGEKKSPSKPSSDSQNKSNFYNINSPGSNGRGTKVLPLSLRSYDALKSLPTSY